jgi:hypothetical protein
MGHEITEAFRESGLPLCRQLTEMLDEHFSHCTERRGCGFTQATRHLASYINLPRDPLDSRDLRLFRQWPSAETEALAEALLARGESRGWRALLFDDAPATDGLVTPADTDEDSAATRLATLRRTLSEIPQQLQREESQLFFSLLSQVLRGDGPPAPDLTGMAEKPEVGSCSQAEEYFLELAHARLRRGASVNVLVDEQGEPRLLEKVGLGEALSAIVVAPIRICGVHIPAGGLCALRYAGEVQGRSGPHGLIVPLQSLAEVRFLRLTTLAVAPELRQRAFTRQLEAQLRASLFSPTTTTIAQLAGFARQALQGR